MNRGLKLAIGFQVAVVAAAVIYLIAFLSSGVGHDHPTLNMGLVLLGVACAGALMTSLWRLTLEREAMIRRFFVSPEWIYNHEIGYAPLEQVIPDGDTYGFVTFAADALARMSYGFEVAEAPDVFEPQLVIDSYVFHFHTTDDPDDGVVVDEWRGTLREVVALDSKHSKRELRDISRFDNAGELASMLEDLAIFADESDGGSDQ